MSSDTALWIGIAAGAVIGATATWITIGLAVALGRYLAHRGQLVGTEPPADTFDNDLRALIKTHGRQT